MAAVNQRCQSICDLWDKLGTLTQKRREALEVRATFKAVNVMVMSECLPENIKCIHIHLTSFFLRLSVLVFFFIIASEFPKLEGLILFIN